MNLEDIVEEFQNYSYNNTNIISSYLNSLKNSSRLVEDDLKIREFMLPEIITLLNKAVLNRLSADLLFQNNYWSWGFVSIYYSNFFLSQALNRLNGDFFTFIPSFGNQGRRNIKLDISDGQYKIYEVDNQFRDSHGGELKKLKENYTFLLNDSTANALYLNTILDIKESNIRNNINYKLDYYRELSFNEFKMDMSLNSCKRVYQNILTENTENDEFKLLKINIDRFNLIFFILKRIKESNETFEVEYNKFFHTFNQEFTYRFTNRFLKNIENHFNKNMNFHTISEVLESQLKRAMHEL